MLSFRTHPASAFVRQLPSAGAGIRYALRRNVTRGTESVRNGQRGIRAGHVRGISPRSGRGRRGVAPPVRERRRGRAPGATNGRPADAPKAETDAPAAAPAGLPGRRRPHQGTRRQAGAEHGGEPHRPHRHHLPRAAGRHPRGPRTALNAASQAAGRTTRSPSPTSSPGPSCRRRSSIPSWATPCS